MRYTPKIAGTRGIEKLTGSAPWMRYTPKIAGTREGREGDERKEKNKFIAAESLRCIFCPRHRYRRVGHDFGGEYLCSLHST